VNKRDVRSATGKLRDSLKKERDDLDCRWAELRKSAKDQYLDQIGSPAADEWLGKVGEITNQRMLNQMRQEALEFLPKPGRKPNSNSNESKPVDKYLPLMQECLAVSRGNMRRARIRFMKEAATRLGVRLGTAQNHWSRLRSRRNAVK
jgi:hypothetical protein